MRLWLASVKKSWEGRAQKDGKKENEIQESVEKCHDKEEVNKQKGHAVKGG